MAVRGREHRDADVPGSVQAHSQLRHILPSGRFQLASGGGQESERYFWILPFSLKNVERTEIIVAK
jgi:hypothetical protein